MTTRSPGFSPPGRSATAMVSRDRRTTLTGRRTNVSPDGSVRTNTKLARPSSTTASAGTSTSPFGASSSTVTVTAMPARRSPAPFWTVPVTSAVCWAGSIAAAICSMRPG